MYMHVRSQRLRNGVGGVGRLQSVVGSPVTGSSRAATGEPSGQ